MTSVDIELRDKNIVVLILVGMLSIYLEHCQEYSTSDILYSRYSSSCDVAYIRNKFLNGRSIFSNYIL
jgi:hypothetical protein